MPQKNRRPAVFTALTALLVLASAACSNDSPDTESGAGPDSSAPATEAAQAPQADTDTEGRDTEDADTDDTDSVYGGDLEILGTALQAATGASDYTVDGSSLHLRFTEGSVEDPTASVNCLVAHEMQDEGHAVVLEYPDGIKDCASDEAVSFAADQGNSGSARASLNIGDLSWEFDQVICAFGEEEIGVEGAEFALSAGNGTASVYAAIDADYTYIEFNDPTAADPSQEAFITHIEPTIEIDGKNIFAPASFGTYEDADTLLMGALTATCP